MKKLLLAALMLFTAQAFALDTANTVADIPFDLMKCNSVKNGTLWASFGHLYTSGATDVAYFPTEVVLFGTDGTTTRKVYLKTKDALNETEVRVRPGRIAFDIEIGNQKHSLTLMLMNPKDTRSFGGNWAASINGSPDSMDMAYCTAH